MYAPPPRADVVASLGSAPSARWTVSDRRGAACGDMQDVVMDYRCDRPDPVNGGWTGVQVTGMPDTGVPVPVLLSDHA